MDEQYYEQMLLGTNETSAAATTTTTTTTNTIDFNWDSRENESNSIPNFTYPFDHMTLFNITELFGPQRDSLLIVIPITIIYSLIFITGVIGNISTCIVIRKNRSMHTATNYYLFSLAISDFMLLLSGVPQEMYFIWSKYPYVFGEAFCIGRGFVAETSANATVLTITAFTAERYVAICHPFLAHAMSKLNRATRIILFIWFASFMTAIPQAAQFGVVDPYGISQCMVLRVIIKHSFQLSTFIFFFAPMSIILVLYLLIGLKLHQTNLMRTTNGNILHRVSANTMRSQSHHGTKRVLKMLVAVVIAFFICWAPFHAQRLIAVYGANSIQKDPKDPLVVMLYTVMTYVSGVLYYLSTCINPLLYNIMSNKFREAFKETLEQWHLCASKANEPKRKYNVLSRPKRLRVTFQESTDYTSSSQPEESFQSTASWKYNDSMTLGYQRTIIYQDKLGICKEECDRSRTLVRQSPNLPNYLQASKTSSDEKTFRDSIVKIDEFDLPSTDASLNVVYTKQGDIQIRLQRKLPPKSKSHRNFRRIVAYFSNILKSRPSPTHMGFYTPPVDDNLSLCSLNFAEKLSGGHRVSDCCDDISNSSLKDVDHIALADELSAYFTGYKSQRNQI